MLNQCFSTFKDIHKGDTCILFGTGTSLAMYEHIDGVRIGSNEMVYYNHPLDYYFIGDAGDKSRGYNQNIPLYNTYTPTCGYKFIRKTPPTHVSKVPEGLSNAKYYSTTSIHASSSNLNIDNIWNGDIRCSMVDTASISFECLQFALFCGFSKICLVGHDCDYSNGTFNSKSRIVNNCNLILNMWQVWKKYIDDNYSINIEVINPVALNF